MPITFDSIEELQRFCSMFALPDAIKPADLKALSLTSPSKDSSPETAVAEETMDAPKARGRKPKDGFASSPAEAPVKESKPRATRDKNGLTLTARIQTVIEKFINKKQEFSANSVYQALAKNDPEVNKQSVITSVLKQMNSLFSDVSFEERPGNGPRPVKMYLP